MSASWYVATDPSTWASRPTRPGMSWAAAGMAVAAMPKSTSAIQRIGHLSVRLGGRHPLCDDSPPTPVHAIRTTYPTARTIPGPAGSPTCDARHIQAAEIHAIIATGSRQRGEKDGSGHRFHEDRERHHAGQPAVGIA